MIILNIHVEQIVKIINSFDAHGLTLFKSRIVLLVVVVVAVLEFVNLFFFFFFDEDKDKDEDEDEDLEDGLPQQHKRQCAILVPPRNQKRAAQGKTTPQESHRQCQTKTVGSNCIRLT